MTGRRVPARPLNRVLHACVLAALLCLTGTAAAHAAQDSASGAAAGDTASRDAALAQRCPVLRIDLRAYAEENGALAYRGLHTQTFSGPVHRIEERYTNADSETVARISYRYRADDLTPVSYRLELPKLGREERVRREGDTLTVQVREERGEEMETDTLEIGDDAMVAFTVGLFILRHWDALLEGRALTFPLLVTGRAETYDFTVRHVPDDEAGGPGRTVIGMEPDSLLVQQVVDPVRFVFESEPPHRLVEYRGRTPIRDAEGDAERLRIVYRYRDGCPAGS